MEWARDCLWANCAPGESVVLVFLRKKSCLIGGKKYSSSIYGDRMTAGDLVVKGTSGGACDRPIREAMRRGLKVVFCVHDGRNSLMPKPVVFGRVTEARSASGSKSSEYVVEALKPFPKGDFVKAFRSPEESKHCWIKKKFLAALGLRLSSGSNLMRCFNQCVLFKNPKAPSTSSALATGAETQN
jgi:hypothetical protein